MRYLLSFFLFFMTLPSFGGEKNLEMLSKIQPYLADGTVVFVEDKELVKSRTPAYINFDLSTNTCHFHYNDLSKYEFLQDSPFLEFMYYHELGHCDLYFSGHFLNSEAANLMLEAEMLNFQKDTHYTYLVLHEIYSDAFAYAFMMKDGWSTEELNKIIQWRTNGSWSSNHKTEDILITLSFIDFTAMDKTEIKKTIKSIVEKNFMKKYVMEKFNWQVENKDTLERSLKSSYTDFSVAMQRWQKRDIKDLEEIFYYRTITNLFKNGVKYPDKYPVFHKAYTIYQSNIEKE